MSIKSTVGNIQHNIGDTASTILTQGKSMLANIVNSTTTGFKSVWSGGFTGMSRDGFMELASQLNGFCNEIDELINGFDQEGDITLALKGDPQTAAYDFIDAVKHLLVAYVSQMRRELGEMEEAYNNFIASGQSIASDVNNAASEIKSNAEQIRLDAEQINLN
mgnify:FL=1